VACVAVVDAKAQCVVGLEFCISGSSGGRHTKTWRITTDALKQFRLRHRPANDRDEDEVDDQQEDVTDTR
jgi:hypothetical protein